MCAKMAQTCHSGAVSQPAGIACKWTKPIPDTYDIMTYPLSLPSFTPEYPCLPNAMQLPSIPQESTSHTTTSPYGTVHEV